jgi:hypothetical protein
LPGIKSSLLKDFTGAKSGEKRNKTLGAASFEARINSASAAAAQRGGLLFSRIFIQRALVEMTSVFLNAAADANHDETHSPGFPISHFFGRLMRS